jgi:photosynthetic reaction center cytochrome c subunit
MRFLPMLLLAVSLFAQEPAAQKQGRPPQAPKNMKVLKVPPVDIRVTMRAYRLGLGVDCEFCHVQGDFASDANPRKEMARKMIVLTQEANAKFTDGKEHVTCYTCHRGAREPLTAPPAQ